MLLTTPGNSHGAYTKIPCENEAPAPQLAHGLLSLKTLLLFSWKVPLFHKAVIFSLGQGWEFTPLVSGNTGTSVSKAGSGVLKEACSGRRGKRTSQQGGVGTLAGRPRGRTPVLRLWRVSPSLRYELGWGATEPASPIQEVEFLISGAELGALKPQSVTQGALSSTTHGWHPLTRSAASLPGPGGGREVLKEGPRPHSCAQVTSDSTGTDPVVPPAGSLPADPKVSFKTFFIALCCCFQNTFGSCPCCGRGVSVERNPPQTEVR